MEPREPGRSDAPPPHPPEPDREPAASGRPDDEAPRRRGNRHHTSRRRNRARQSQSRRDNSDAARGNPGRLQAEMPSGRVPGARAADDPGTVPLGTDDEAAGTPPSAEAVETETERARADRDAERAGLTAEDAMRGRTGHPGESPRGFGRFVTIGAAIVLALIILFWLF